jgi:hypothetical protein
VQWGGIGFVPCSVGVLVECIVQEGGFDSDRTWSVCRKVWDLQASKRYVPNSSSVPLHALIVVLYNPLFFKLTERELRVFTYLGVVAFAL